MAERIPGFSRQVTAILAAMGVTPQVRAGMAAGLSSPTWGETRPGIVPQEYLNDLPAGAPGVAQARKTGALDPSVARLLEEVRRKRAEESSRGGPDTRPHRGFLHRVLDVLGRPGQAVEGFVTEAGRADEAMHAAGRRDVGGLHGLSAGLRGALHGIAGTRHYSGSQILQEAGVHNRVARTVGGLGLDIGTDPLSYLGLGVAKSAVTAPAKLAAGERAVAETARQAPGVSRAALRRALATDVPASETLLTPAQKAARARSGAGVVDEVAFEVGMQAARAAKASLADDLVKVGMRPHRAKAAAVQWTTPGLKALDPKALATRESWAKKILASPDTAKTGVLETRVSQAAAQAEQDAARQLTEVLHANLAQGVKRAVRVSVGGIPLAKVPIPGHIAETLGKAARAPLAAKAVEAFGKAFDTGSRFDRELTLAKARSAGLAERRIDIGRRWLHDAFVGTSPDQRKGLMEALAAGPGGGHGVLVHNGADLADVAHEVLDHTGRYVDWHGDGSGLLRWADVNRELPRRYKTEVDMKKDGISTDPAANMLAQVKANAARLRGHDSAQYLYALYIATEKAVARDQLGRALATFGVPLKVRTMFQPSAETAPAGLRLYRSQDPGSLGAGERMQGAYFRVVGSHNAPEHTRSIYHREGNIETHAVSALGDERILRPQVPATRADGGGFTAGTAALRHLAGPAEFQRLWNLNPKVLTGEIKDRFHVTVGDIGKYDDPDLLLLEIYGAQLAEKRGYAAIHYDGGGDNEFVALSDKAVRRVDPGEFLAPQTAAGPGKMLGEQATGAGRELVDRFGYRHITTKGLDRTLSPAYSRHLDPLVFDPDIAHGIERVMQVADNPSDRGDLLRFYDSVLSRTKKFLTLPSPAFHLRNSFGDMWLGYLDDVKGPRGLRSYDQAARVLARLRGEKGGAVRQALSEAVDPVTGRAADPMAVLGALAKGTREGKAGAELMKTPRSWPDAPGGKLTSEQVWAAYSHAGLNRGYVAADLEQALGTARGPAAALGAVSEKLGDVSQLRENYFRLAHFVDRLKRSKAPTFARAAEEAAGYVRKYHFDYHDVTPTEAAVFSRIMPFYKWQRFALPLVLQMFFARPGKILNTQKALYAASSLGGYGRDDSGLPAADGVLPRYFTDAMMIPLYQSIRGNTVYANPGLPGTQVPLQTLGLAGGTPGEAAANAGKNVMQSINPWVTTPFELQHGVNAFGGRAEFGPNYLLSKAPLSALPGKVAGNTGDTALRSYLSGLGLQEDTPSRQRGVLMEELRRISANRKKAGYQAPKRTGPADSRADRRRDTRGG